MDIPLHYNPKLKKLARELRNKSTKSEIILWGHLRAENMRGYNFLRQKPIDEYIVDFYCPKLRLVIEIDGISHNSKQEEDVERQRRLESLGLSVLRFSDLDVKNNLQGVCIAIEKWIEHKERESL